MNIASTTGIIDAALGPLYKLALALLGWSMTNWIPILIGFTVVGVVIAALWNKIGGFFHPGGKK